MDTPASSSMDIQPHATTGQPARGGACFIVPPYLLETLRSSGDAELQQIVERTLRHDQQIRQARQPGAGQLRAGAATSSDAASGAGSGTGSTEKVDRKICDAKHTTQLPGTVVRTEGAAASSDVAVDEAYDALGDTWNLYHDVYGRNSVDGKGLQLVGSVHYSRDYDNAFWNGDQMVFGDGDGTIFTRFTASVDVIGHELTHGVTQYTAALVYSDQPGALNESVSDVFGSLVKQYALGQTADQADWLIGAGILGPTIKGRALRDMLHPGTAYDDPQLGTDPQPADMQHYVTTSDDNGGVHINSGIPNRAFALAATTAGGKAWETVGPVWYDVLTGAHIQARCDFATFAQLTVDAATARYGADHAITTAVRQAWVTVGVLEATTGSGTADTAGVAGAAGGRQASAPAQSDANAQPSSVEVRRTGGFAGVSRQTTVKLDQLPTQDAETWRGLLTSSQLHEYAAQATPDAVRDGFHYTVRCPERGVDLSLSEAALPTHLRHLFERTLDAD